MRHRHTTLPEKQSSDFHDKVCAGVMILPPLGANNGNWIPHPAVKLPCFSICLAPECRFIKPHLCRIKHESKFTRRSQAPQFMIPIVNALGTFTAQIKATDAFWVCLYLWLNKQIKCNGVWPCIVNLLQRLMNLDVTTCLWAQKETTLAILKQLMSGLWVIMWRCQVLVCSSLSWNGSTSASDN